MIATPRCYTFADAQECLLPEEVGEFAAAASLVRVSIRIGPEVLTIAFLDGTAAILFMQRYHDMLAHLPVPAVEIDFYAVHVRDNLYLWSRLDRAWVVDIPQNAPHLTAFFADNAMMIDFVEKRNVISIHSAVLAEGGRACAILGVSTAGKTTTAVACASTGFEFYSDERCLLANGIVTPFPRTLNLRSNGRRRLLIDDGIRSEHLLAALRRSDAQEEMLVAPSQLLPRVATRPAKLHAVFVISGYASAPAIMRADLYELLPDLMLSMSMRERGLDRMARALHELQKMQLFRLILGSPSETAAAIAEATRYVA